MTRIQDFTLPPQTIMYTVPRKKEAKLRFADIEQDALFSGLNEDQKKHLRKCKIEVVYRTKMEAVRVALGKKVEGMSNAQIERHFRDYERYIFALKTNAMLVIGQKDKQYILLRHLLHRTCDLYKRCRVCDEWKEATAFRIGGRCRTCENRIKKDKREVRDTLLSYVDTIDTIDTPYRLYGKYTWEIDVSQSIVNVLARAELIDQDGKDVYMLYDAKDLHEQGTTIAQLFD